MKTKENILAIALVAIVFLTCVITACEKDDDSGGSSSCPTTAACGCSAYNKVDCNAHTLCCKWTVGQGCGCK